ncbi:MAG: hypothetical protein CMK07_15450 [Ponticaulis sp.]|nr:hypothetical protein [Ponticaulis sp.]
MFKSTLTAICFTVSLVPGAIAQAFSAEDVDRFVATMEELEPLSEKYEDYGIDVEVPGMPDPSAMMMGGPMPEIPLDDEGRLSMFRGTFEKNDMSNHPGFGEGNAIIKQNGYADYMDFATDADYIMAAYMAIELEGEDLDMSGMDASQLSQLPPAMRAQLEPALNYVKAMVTAIQAVPQSEVDIAKSKKSVLDAAFAD